jgi:hypothetical protein
MKKHEEPPAPPGLTADELRELKELRALKAEFTKAGLPNKKVTRDNLLMKKCGADFPYRYDGFPPDHYLFAARHGTPHEKLMATVYASTIAIGRNSPYMVDDEGNPMDVEDIAAKRGWGIKYAEGELLDAELDGLIRRDPEIRGKTRKEVKRKIWLCAKVAFAHTDSKGVTKNEECVHTPTLTQLSLSLRCEPYLKKAFEALPEDVQRETLDRHLAINDLELLPDAVAAVRSIKELLHLSNWEHAGVKVRERKPTDGRTTRSRPAQSDLEDPFSITTGYVHLRLAKALPADVLVDADQPPADAPKDAAQQPALPILESVQTPAHSASASKDEESVRIEKRNVHTPTSLLHPLTLSEDTSNTVETTIHISHSAPDGPMNAQRSAQEAPPPPTPRQTPPEKAAARPRATSAPRGAVPRAPQPPKPSPAAEARAAGQRTGLTGTPSIELRAQTARMREIAAAIPKRATDRLHDDPTTNLLAQCDHLLCGAPVEWFAEACAAVPHATWTSIGLARSIAARIGSKWIDGAAQRAKDAQEQERTAAAVRRHEEEQLTAKDRKRARLLAHPEECPMCGGAGFYSSDKLPAELRPRIETRMMCACPAGEARAKGAT